MGLLTILAGILLGIIIVWTDIYLFTFVLTQPIHVWMTIPVQITSGFLIVIAIVIVSAGVTEIMS